MVSMSTTHSHSLLNLLKVHELHCVIYHKSMHLFILVFLNTADQIRSKADPKNCSWQWPLISL